MAPGRLQSVYETHDLQSEDNASYLAAIKQRWSARGFDVECREPQMRPAEAIVEIARETGADLIAMATHGRISLNSVVAIRWASTIGEGFGWLFILAGLWLVFAGDVVNGIWFALIGWMIQNAAAAYRHAPTANALQTLTVRDVMTRTVDPIPRDIPLDAALYRDLEGRVPASQKRGALS